MAEESSAGGERTEAPSAKRREDFRNKGQVAQSKEVQTAALLTIVFLFWVFYSPVFWKGLSQLLTSLFQHIHAVPPTTSATLNLAWFICKKSALLLTPLFLLVLVIGFFATFLQIGWLFTTKPLVPDLSKLDPIKGAGRFFSRRSIVELVKSLAKVGLIAWIAYTTLISQSGEALLLVDTPPGNTLLFLGKVATLILAKVCAIIIFLAFLDLLFVRWEMEEKMKMTKQEVKEEHKEVEGDPHVKAQIRSIQQQMAKKRMMAEVPGADVVVTNPTHFAVALKYTAANMDAPRVVAKGKDLVALRIREIAKENDVPVVENPPVARLLHKVDLEASIPEELFKAVAEILAHVYSLQGNKR